jgi:hypothetical protein
VSEPDTPLWKTAIRNAFARSIRECPAAPGTGQEILVSDVKAELVYLGCNWAAVEEEVAKMLSQDRMTRPVFRDYDRCCGGSCSITEAEACAP